jgi:hypothetical protein
MLRAHRNGSRSSRARLAEVSDFLQSNHPTARLLIVAASLMSSKGRLARPAPANLSPSCSAPS